ncbi:hypothetical protein IVA79_04155 [Bradyrhizobium sp. 138]|nr:hypothetical protein [Bradyrhizobium sp. 138]
MLGDLDVIIEIDPAALPLGILVRLIWQWGQRRAIEHFEQVAPASPPAPERSSVQLDKERVNCFVKGGEREEAAGAQARQNPSPDTIWTPTSTLALSRGRITASRSLATALWRARFASGLLGLAAADSGDR